MHVNYSRTMFEKIIKKLKGSSCKTKVADDANVFKESEKKQEDTTKWNTSAEIAVLTGKATQILLERCLFMKKLMLKINQKNKIKYHYNQCNFNWVYFLYFW